jgi:hypothetical protein
MFGGHEVTALVDAGRSGWALIEGAEVWCDDGSGWSRRALIEGPRGKCILPGAAGIVVGTSRAHLLWLTEGGPERITAFDGAPGRSEWYTPWGGPPDTRSLTGTAQTLFVNVHVGGILRSRDRGASWSQTMDITADVHQVLAREGMVVAATARGLATSDDEGESWIFDDDNLHAPYCRAVALANDVVLVTACVGPHGGRAGLYRRPLDRPGGLERCRSGLPEWFGDNIDTHCVHARGSDVAFGTSDGSVFASSDAGATWQQLCAHLPPVRAVVVT